MKVILVGSGGREHALAAGLARSPTCDELHCAPGNPGIAASRPATRCGVDDVEGLARSRERARVGPRRVGPEAPLVPGSATCCAAPASRSSDRVRRPRRLEGSKAFAKEVMARRRRADRAPRRRAPVRRGARGDRRARRRASSSRPTGSRPARASACARRRGRGGARRRPRYLDGAFGEAGATVVIEERLARPRGLAARAVRRRGVRAARRRRRTSSGSATATRARTPAAWARTRRCRGSTTGAARGACERVHVPVLRELAAAASTSAAASTPV